MSRLCAFPLLLLLPLLLLIPTSLEAGEVIAVTTREPGLHKETSALADGTKVRYTVSVPKGFSRGKRSKVKYALVLALHYGGEVTPFYGAGLIQGLVEPGLKGLGAIIVAPDSLGDQWQGGKDERYILALLDGFHKAYPIDPKRVVVTGFSMGGIGTWYYALKYPKRFSAAVPIAGQPTGKGLKIPVFAIHSRRDATIAIEPTETRIKALEKKGHNAKIKILTDLEHFAVPSYAKHLKDVVPWLKKLWKPAYQD